MNFLFACGGTAGHINPALAIAEQLGKLVPGSRFLFIGAGREMENRLIPSAGYELVNIKMSGLKRGFAPSDIVHNIKTAGYLMSAGKEAAKFIKNFSPQAAIGTGGYICYPVLKKAAQLGIPTIVHESNAVPGLTTKMLSAIVDRVLVSFPGLEDTYKKPERVVFTGTPVRGGFELGKAKSEGLKTTGKPLVLSFWGSLGAEHMNEKIAEFIKLNIERDGFDHIHATGKSGGADEMNGRLAKLGAAEQLPPGIDIREYIDDMHSAMSAADIVMCRAGGSTVAELTAMGKPAVLIPSPYVSNNEQEKNAQQLVNAGGAVLLDEEGCSGKLLFDTVADILADEQRLMRMSEAQASLGVPEAARRIAEIVLSLSKNTK